tara:strand:- start:1036 stop:2439 length:1404 start_codon:yes stop_codon:yes gene_type:complete
MANQDIALMAHLIRRAGFGATRDEIEAYVAKGYETVVEELLDTDVEPASDRFTMMRFQPQFYKPGTIQGMGGAEWVHNMVNTKRPLEEKMALFWHGLFAAGVSKVDHYDEVMTMVYKFRKYGLGDYRELLLQMARDPSMIYWLDNCENHADAVNENWGRELLELFSMGVGNYTEVDVRDCSRAFTGWTFEPKLPRFPIGRFEWSFQYREDDHDDTEKTFLGQTGNFDGEDIIRIISENPACAKFIARHLYSYFVADEVQVPAWSVTPPRDPEAVDLLANTLMNNDYDMRSTLRVLFNSEFFKNARYERLKNPTEVVIGALRMVGGSEFPAPGIGELASQPKYMGQDLLNPPSVEGWHTGAEWINSGSLMRRINFTAELVGDVSRPGIKNMVDRLITNGDTSAGAIVDSCLDLMGPLEVNPESLTELNGFVAKGGDFAWNSEADIEKSTARVSALLQLIVSLREFQYA